jgi:hypothetical protein
MISGHDRKVAEALSWIKNASPNASILAEYDLFPHISNMIDAYVIPPPFTAFRREYYYEYANSLYDKKLDYIIIDLNPDVRTYAHYMAHLLTFKNVYEKGNYGLYASIDGVLIYKYGYKGNLTEFIPFTIHNNYEAKIGADTTLFGQYFPPGIYNITYCLEISPKVDENETVCTLQVEQNRSIIKTVDVFGNAFAEAEKYETFTFSITIFNPKEEIDFMIIDPSIHTEIKINWLKISIINHLPT